MNVSERRFGKLHSAVFTVGVLCMCIVYIFSQQQIQVYHNLKCLTKVVKFSDRQLTKTALASFPGSGNTWIRHLIEQSTGIATGSVYCDRLLIHVFKGECSTNMSNILIKTHYFPSKDIFDKVVLVIRSPFKAITSYFNLFYTGNQTGVASNNKFSKYFQKFFITNLERWKTFYFKWITEFAGPKYVIIYGNMKSNISLEMRKLLTFLDVKYSERDFLCMLKNTEGVAHRNISKNKIIDGYLTSFQMKETERTIRYIEQLGQFHKIDQYI